MICAAVLKQSERRLHACADLKTVVRGPKPGSFAVHYWSSVWVKDDAEVYNFTYISAAAIVPSRAFWNPSLYQHDVKDKAIPCVIQQVWKSNVIPIAASESIKSWLIVNSMCKYKLWTFEGINQVVSTHFPELSPKYNSNQTTDMQRSAIGKFIVAYIYGRVFPDLDLESLRLIDGLLSANTILISQLPKVHARFQYETDFYLSTAFIATVPRHKFIQTVIGQWGLQEYSDIKSNSLNPTDRLLMLVYRNYQSTVTTPQQHPINIAMHDEFNPVFDEKLNVRETCEKQYSKIHELQQLICDQIRAGYLTNSPTHNSYSKSNWLNLWSNIPVATESINIADIVPAENMAIE